MTKAIRISIIVKPLVYYQFGLYRRVWAYASIRELKLIALAVTTASIIVLVLVSLLSTLVVVKDFSRSVLIIDWLLSLLAVGGLRFSYRIIAESLSTSKQSESRPKRVLIVGAGDAGALVVREMQRNPQANLIPIGFIDDDPVKLKQEIHGIPVIGKLDELGHLIDVKHSDEVIIAIPSAPGQVIRKVTDICRIKNYYFWLSSLLGSLPRQGCCPSVSGSPTPIPPLPLELRRYLPEYWKRWAFTEWC
jgi:FlaA1/EpsC-like NDP-sugar epimerase